MVRIRSRRHGSALPRRRVPGAGCPEIDSALSGVFVWAEMAAFRLTGRGTAPVLYCRANGWGDKNCLCCDVCRYWLASNFADAFLFSLSFDCEFHVLYPRVMRRLPLHAHPPVLCGGFYMACLYLVLCCAAVVCCLHFTLVLCGGDFYAWLAYRSVLCS